MTTQNHVLVIIPTFNRAHFLPEALDSALNQSYSFIKIIVVDDGSTDDTESVVTNYQEQYPRIITYIRKVNGGCSSARNTGLAQISNDIGYVCFLDSDDRLLPNLKDRIDLLNRYPSAAFCYADSIIFEEDTKQERLSKVAAADQPDKFAIEHFLTSEAKTASILYRADIVKNRKFCQDMLFNEDSEFLQRVGIEYTGVYFNEPASWVRSHAGSKSKNRASLLKAVLQANSMITRDYPLFYRSFTDIIDSKTEQLRQALFVELLLAEEWREAELYAADGWARLHAKYHLKIYYKAKRSVGQLIRHLNLR